MSGQAQRLEELLARVQENRKQPRAAEPAAPPMAAPAAAPMAARAPAPAPARVQRAEPETVDLDPFMSEPPAAPAPAPRMPAPAPHPASPPGTALATPLELALEDEVVRASREPAQARPMAKPPAAPMAPMAPMAAASPPSPAVHAGPPEGRVLADPGPMAASRPIAQAVTKHPPVTGQTFGDLLRRSLSLRPR